MAVFERLRMHSLGGAESLDSEPLDPAGHGVVPHVETLR